MHYVPLYCSVTGVLIAYPLLRHMNSVGVLSVAAKLKAACASPSLLAPSPKYTTEHVFAPDSCETHTYTHTHTHTYIHTRTHTCER